MSGAHSGQEAMVKLFGNRIGYALCMFDWHKWTLWTVPVRRRTMVINGIPIDSTEYEQSRACRRCNMYQVQILR